MKRLTCVLTISLILMMSFAVKSTKYEGDVIGVNLLDNTLILQQNDGRQIPLKVGAHASLYYNNIEADLAMYAPITNSDFLSGYLLTDELGVVQEASFYYLVREGVISRIEKGSLVFEEIDHGISCSYQLLTNVEVLLNNLPADLETIEPGMRVLVFLNHNFKVRKIAIFHYDYLGFVEQINLDDRTIVLNIGSRLKPKLQEFSLAKNVTEIGLHWEKININLQNNCILLAKVMLEEKSDQVEFIDIRTL